MSAAEKLQPLSETEKILRDELYCIADSKLVLAGWYMIVLPNGRAISDWSAICAMMQAQYGHARAIYQYLGRYGVTREEVEWQRGAADIRSPKLLDKPPASWADFIVTVFLAEQMIMTQLASYKDSIADRTLARLAAKVHRESRFHRSYMVGWLKALQTDPQANVGDFAGARLMDALDWWNVSGSDVLFGAGYRDAPESELQDTFVNGVMEVLGLSESDVEAAKRRSNEGWARHIRRAGQPGIPATLFELIKFKHIELALP
jgi:1,2-phenylacetyl-CoA epoxidase catalytic subunit